MLENNPLLLRPGAADLAADGAAAALEPAQVIVDALTGVMLGFAGWRRRGGGFWRRWLARPVLAIHEGDDAPLLCTVHALWGLSARWEVRDADGHVLGTLHGSLIKDRFGRDLALTEPAAAGGRARDADGNELMTLLAAPEGLRVSFAPAAEGNPFLKMLPLAAALVGIVRAPA